MTTQIAVALIVLIAVFVWGYRKGRSNSIVIVVPPPQLPNQDSTASIGPAVVTIFAFIIILGILIS